MFVNEQMRAQFCPPFATKELHDLSVVGIKVLCRKP
jgi:hypothetical protein